jgi:hypothetical protein
MKSSSVVLSAIMRTAFVLAVALATIVAAERSAHAATGWVTGKWKFWNVNGNYCPDAANCVGTRVPQAAFDEELNLSNAHVIVQDVSGNILGQGFTNNSGNYTLQWTSPTSPGHIKVGVISRHSRFVIANAAGGWPTIVSPSIATAASSASSPQNVGTRTVGNSNAPNPYFNDFFSVELLYRNVLSLVGVFTNNFTGVEIRGYANTIPGFIAVASGGTCGSSCAWGPTKRVQLDSNAEYSPAARSMHEVGHIASYLARTWQIGIAYANGSTWGQALNENGSALFEEALATHYSSMGLWFSTPVMPTTCLVAQGHCYTNAASNAVPQPFTDIEATSFPAATNNCIVPSPGNPNDESRWPLSGMRFLWDVYDARNDATGDAYSANAGHFWQHASLMQFYAAGTGLRQHEEPWNTAKTAVTEVDGRGVNSYQWNYENTAGLAGNGVPQLWVSNCSPK